MSGPLSPTWATEDLPVLSAAIELLDEKGRADGPEVAKKLGLAPEAVVRSLRRLDGDYLTIHLAARAWGGGQPPIGFVFVKGATAAARRAAGQWPNPEAISREVLAELERVAKDNPGEKGSKLRALLSATAEPGAGFLGTVLGTAISRALGMP